MDTRASRLGAARNRQPRGDRTRSALVASALDLFAAHGVEATSVDEITTAAHVAKGTFYVHFQRKQDVLLERAAQHVHELQGQQFTGDPEAALGLMAAGLAESMAATPRVLVGRMLREVIGNRDDWLRTLGPRPSLGELIRPIIERGQTEGRIRTDQSPARLAQGCTILWLDTLIGWAERPSPQPLADALDLATSLFLHGAGR